MSATFPECLDEWILEKAPARGVAVSSRARLARNLPDRPFAPRADSLALARVADRARTAIEASPALRGYRRFDLSSLPINDRRFLRESHLISSEQEKGREHREVWLAPDGRTSIMVNEEDHLRVQTLTSGLRLADVYAKADEVERALEEGGLAFAYSRRFGYLTACPTNAGTGLRLSVMLHLVGLAMTGRIDSALEPLGGEGLVARGAYGEHSTNAGDLFQISNEATLGRSEDELMEVLGQRVETIVGMENEAREYLRARHPIKCEDAVERALGLLGRARRMDSTEATTLLSHVRLGVERNPAVKIGHEQLDRLLVEVQPAHLLRRAPDLEDSMERDVARAAFLREKFGANGTHPN